MSHLSDPSDHPRCFGMWGLEADAVSLRGMPCILRKKNSRQDYYAQHTNNI